MEQESAYWQDHSKTEVWGGTIEEGLPEKEQRGTWITLETEVLEAVPFGPEQLNSKV